VEVKNQNSAWLDESHPNFKKWLLARKLSIERGKFVYTIVNQKVGTNNLSVLDLGSGEGGTAKVFSKDNFVVSLDLSLDRLKRQISTVISKESSTEKSSTNDEDRFLSSFEMTSSNIPNYLARVNGSAIQLPFKDQSFNLIIIQDVIEHISDTNNFYSEIMRVLKPNGNVFISTPNKFSIFNFISDPHFGLPIVSILNRASIKKYFLKYFRKSDFHREDIAELFSLNGLVNLFQNDFEISLNTKFSVKELFNGNMGIIWSDFHFKLIAFCKLIKLDKVLVKISNNKFGVINKYFTPTFYIVFIRKETPIALI
jgi:ubiquinone/menaquinone biosynthesis C-methylase UbiE